MLTIPICSEKQLNLTSGGQKMRRLKDISKYEISAVLTLVLAGLTTSLLTILKMNGAIHANWFWVALPISIPFIAPVILIGTLELVRNVEL